MPRRGLGRELEGEGLIGLTRPFLHAGAAAVVASLWQVADRSTADLVLALCAHLENGQPADEALRQTKLELLDGGAFDHPYYWAPFVLIGRP